MFLWLPIRTREIQRFKSFEPQTAVSGCISGFLRTDSQTQRDARLWVHVLYVDNTSGIDWGCLALRKQLWPTSRILHTSCHRAGFDSGFCSVQFIIIVAAISTTTTTTTGTTAILLKPGATLLAWCCRSLHRRQQHISLLYSRPCLYSRSTDVTTTGLWIERMGCDVCVCVWVCARYYCDCRRYYWSVLKIAPQSTAAQKDEAPKPWALLRYPQCSARWLIYPGLQRWKRKRMVLTTCPPPPPPHLLPQSSFSFIYFSNSYESLWVSVSVTKGKTHKVKTQSERLYCDMLFSRLWEAHGWACVCHRAGKGNRSRDRLTAVWRVESRERESVCVCVCTGKRLHEWYNMRYLHCVFDEVSTVTVDLLFPVTSSRRI